MSRVLQLGITAVCTRYAYGISRNETPPEWNTAEEKNDALSELNMEDRLKSCIGGLLSMMYATNAELGIFYENIISNRLDITSRTALYNHLGIEMPDTGREQHPLNDDIPAPMQGINPFRAFLINMEEVEENDDEQMNGQIDTDHDQEMVPSNHNRHNNEQQGDIEDI